MIHSQAFNSLSGKGHILISYILSQCRYEKIGVKKGSIKYKMLNSDHLLIPYSTLKEKPFKMVNSTITKSIDELLSKGLIKVVKQGGAKKGDTSVYGLSEAYLKWTKGDPPVSIRRPYSCRGFCAKPAKEK